MHVISRGKLVLAREPVSGSKPSHGGSIVVTSDTLQFKPTLLVRKALVLRARIKRMETSLLLQEIQLGALVRSFTPEETLAYGERTLA